jgi:hypothetical protein
LLTGGASVWWASSADDVGEAASPAPRR